MSGLTDTAPGPVTLTESFGSVRPKAPSTAASSFFGGYALEGRQRERLTQRRGISNPTDLYAMLREFGSSIVGAVTVSEPGTASQTKPHYEPISEGEFIKRLQRAANDGDLGIDEGETLPAAAAREALEETGITIDPPTSPSPTCATTPTTTDRPASASSSPPPSGPVSPSTPNQGKCSEIGRHDMSSLRADIVSYISTGLQACARNDTFSLDSW